MARRPTRKYLETYRKSFPTYERLSRQIASTLETLLTDGGIDFLDITHRAKSVESLAAKIKLKPYKNPLKDITDLAGIRVIALIERDLDLIEKIIRRSFNVHDEKSINKSAALGVDRFGYRSVHYVCDVGQDRSRIAEFKPFHDLCFEIQVRTALQHAWAEIEHDRNYKFSGELPSHIKRRFSLVAGMLELADREFNAVTEEIEKYASATEQKIRRSEFEIEVNSTSVRQYLAEIVRELGDQVEFVEQPLEEDIVGELRDFGVTTLENLNKIFSKEFTTSIADAYSSITSYGLLRDAMLYHDMPRYFESAWKSRWGGMDRESIAFLSRKYPAATVREMLENRQIDMQEDTDFGDDVEIDGSPI